MPDTNFWQRHALKISVAMILTFASGVVDIAGYIGVFHFFTAHVTGTTVQLGYNAARRNWSEAGPAATVVLAFFLGSVLGRTIIKVGSRIRLRRVASLTLAIEAALLAVTAHFGATSGTSQAPAYAWPRLFFLALLAGSMGLQTATLTGIGPLTVHTTFVTGMVNKLAQLVSHLGFHTYDLLRRRTSSGARAERRADAQKATFLLAIWLLYLSGAAAGSLLFGSWGLKSLYLSVALLCSAVLIDQFSPLSMQEEKEEAEN